MFVSRCYRSSTIKTLNIVLFVLLTTLSLQAWAIDCPSNNIVLSTQAEVDAFQATYGGDGICDTVNGSLRVSGNDITNIDALTNLVSAQEIFIEENEVLTNLDGLANLVALSELITSNNEASTNLDSLASLNGFPGLNIGSNEAPTHIDGLETSPIPGSILSISNNDALTNIDGLANLVRVVTLYIINNDLLTNINSLTNLTSMGTLIVSDNDSLTNIDGLANLTNSVDLIISNNGALTNIDGLGNLTDVWQLGISGDALTNIDGLANLTSGGQTVSISSNAALTNVDGLASLTDVGGNLYIDSNPALTNLDGLTNLTSVGVMYLQSNMSLGQCAGLSRLVDQWDDAEPGPGPEVSGIPDVFEVVINNNSDGCNSVEEILATVDSSNINPGLNDAWFNPETNGQGFFITVFPDLNAISLAWFTYDTELPADDAQANLGDPGHRWMTAAGPISGNQAIMRIEMTSGGIFDTATQIDRTDPPGSDGTIVLTFDSCNTGTVEYDIPSINRSGTVPIERVADDNITLCEALITQ